MVNKPKQQDGKSALDIIEESISLVRGAGISALAPYYIGSLPFILGLLYFWADMSKSAFARSALVGHSFVLAILFVWMKAWQSVYASRLLKHVTGEPIHPLTVGAFFRIVVRQGIIQPSGLFVLPVALLLLLPFGPTYAFYQNFTALDEGNSSDPRPLMRKSAGLASLWRRQNFFLIWALSPFLLVFVAGFYLALTPIISAIAPDWTGTMFTVYAVIFILLLMPLSPFGLAVAINIGAAIMLIPQLLHSLLGIETTFTIASGGGVNFTFFAVVCGLAYLCMDPLVKAAYVLRCFYGESLNTGLDLSVELKRFAGKAAAIALLLILALGVPSLVAAETLEPADRKPETTQTSMKPADLSGAIDTELQNREYAWRMPRDKVKETEEETVIGAFLRYIAEALEGWFKRIGKWIGKILEWLLKLLPRPEMPGVGPGDISAVRGPLVVTLYVLLAAILCVAGVLLYRLYKNRAARSSGIATLPLPAIPDIEDENTSADAMAEDGWLKMARELTERGQLRLALRAVFLGTLAYLGERNLINIARFKSNRDYKVELSRRAHENPQVLEIFSDSVTVYEAIWYGMHDATMELLTGILANEERLRGHARQE